MKTLDLVIKEKTVEQFKIPVNAVIEKELQAKYVMNTDAFKFATEVITDEIDDFDITYSIIAVYEINDTIQKYIKIHETSVVSNKEVLKDIVTIILNSFR